ncbi:MAG: aminomethyl-transferring glycine dehydrogenase [Bacteroidia bacterium]
MNSHASFSDKFRNRHIGPDEQETKEMLTAVGVDSLDQLISETIPAKIRLEGELNLQPALSEFELLRMLKQVASKNKVYRSYIGMGYYNTITPSAIQRNIFENPGWYTAYTPYQSEVAQGRLEALLNFQTMVSDLTGMEIANASLLDEATAAAEAMAMLHSLKKKHKGNTFYVSDKCFEQTLDVLKTRAIPMGIDLKIAPIDDIEFTDEVYGVLMQYPDGHGNIRDYHDLCKQAHSHGAFVAVAADLMSLVLLTPPGNWGADVAVGNTQRFGVPLGYGGPHAAYFATKEEYKRSIPGRIIGVSVDAQGNQALRMALQTREQHIRREKATSNICTAQVLLAVMAGMYGVYHGPKGLRRIASQIHSTAKLLSNELNKLGFNQLNEQFFDTLHIDLGGVSEDAIRAESEKREINFRYIGGGTIGISVDETTIVGDVADMLSAFAAAGGKTFDRSKLELKEHSLPAAHLRTDEILTHPVFNTHHSETELMRYMKSLENKDLSLVHSMIALGSCTMKLNAATELMPVSWPQFSQMHPFVPVEQAAGYHQIIAELEDELKEITGFHGMSLQPNSGAQGEYAGLMVIREYHLSRGDGHRNIALIPQSAHGTNPASAVMAGMKVVVVRCDDQGNIDLDDLHKKAEEHKNDLACLMVTYPSTHGVYETEIREVCKTIHEHGGQVYMDGANMNAQVGLTNPGLINADVCHLNLHKTFCIPHGGGGPGMGPIGVAKHLTPFLPGHSVIKMGGEKAISAISAAPWGSANILLISYIYIKMMGTKGLTEATQFAILGANYLKARLDGHYNVLYSGKNGRVAHELILDPRGFKQSAGVEVEDIAKRLIDYGFHAPTVSFPVPGTLMIEPTESESKAELDRFIEAMISIKNEIAEIEAGTADKEVNVLKNAPHTAMVVTADEWTLPYSRQKAAYPLPWLKHSKFWPSVGRVNNPFGDRNLMCTCPPIEEYEEALV